MISNLISTSKQLHFTISPSKSFKQPSVASFKGDKSSHNISGLSSLFGNIQPVMSYQLREIPQPFTPSDLHEHATSPPTTQQQEPFRRQPRHPNSYPNPSSTSSRLTKGPFQDYCCEMFFSAQMLIHRSFSGPPESFENN